MRYAKWMGTGGAVLVLALVAGCGGGSSSSTTPPPSNVSVTISPASSTVGYGSTKQFTATATVTGSTNTAVNWTVSSSSSSSSTQIGTISASGLYTAPVATSVPSANTAQTFSVSAGQTASGINISVPPLNSITSVTVTATSQADTSMSASATVTLSGLSILGVGLCVQSTTQTGAITCTANVTGTAVSPGQTAYLFVVGYGILPGTTYSISGTDVTIPTQPSEAGGNFATTTAGYPAVYFQVVVSPTAVLGPRNLVVTNSGNELTSFPGALSVIQ